MRWHWYYIPFVPFTLAGFIATLLLAIVYRPTSIRWRHGCLELVAGTFERKNDKTGAVELISRIWGRPHGQCLGAPAQWYKSKRHRDRPRLRVHERSHTIQGIIVNALAAPLALLGLLWWPLYGLPLLAFGLAYGGQFLYLLAAVGPGDKKTPRWKKAYYRIWAERQAYRVQDEFERGLRPEAWGAHDS